ncbi:MAG: hypothetical protein IKZ88_00585 [Neisseriaceae bacterium]|nr:hypothetical protein [Neisseriaceae bacterium]
MGFMFCLVRQNRLFLDNASIFFSGCLKGKIEALSNNKTVKPKGLT